jgi:hypothetical protein
MPELLNDELPPAEASRLRDHLGSCSACREEFQELNDTWMRLGILEEERPGPELRRDFYRRLEAFKKELAPELRPSRLRSLARLLVPGWNWTAPSLRFASVAAIVALGFAAGFFSGAAKNGDPARMAALNREMGDLRQQVSLALLSQPSASARLQGLSMTSELQDPDPALLKTLLSILDQDPNVNVRLSAVDALYLFADRDDVRGAIPGLLARQTSPLVQIALIDLTVSLREKRAAAALKKILADERTLPEVRQRAQAGISRII